MGFDSDLAIGLRLWHSADSLAAGIRFGFLEPDAGKEFPGSPAKYKYLWLIAGLILTGLTFFFGVYPSGEGPHLWLQIGNVYFQPSEPLKLLLIIFLAAYLADKIPVTFNFARLVAPSFALFLAALAILIAQRDLGTAAIFVVLYVGIIFLASQRWRMLVVGGIFLVAAAFLGFRLYHVIQIRISAWLNPWLDPAGGSYQIVQSLLAFASGGCLVVDLAWATPVWCLLRIRISSHRPSEKNLG